MLGWVFARLRRRGTRFGLAFAATGWADTPQGLLRDGERLSDLRG